MTRRGGYSETGQRVFGRIRAEEPVALRAAMSRVHKVDIAWPTGHQVAHVMQDAGGHTVSKARFPTTGTRTMRKVPRASNDLRLRQILWLGDALSRIRQVLSGTRHNKALLGQVIRPRNLGDLLI